MTGESGDRSPSDDRKKRRYRRGSGRFTENRYRRLHTTLFVLGAILFTTAIVITVIMFLSSII